jgi:CYTH domain-containing protein
MAIETERKFLVKGEFKHLSVQKMEIAQFYLVKDPSRTIRIRICDEEAFLTIKSQVMQGTISRNEWEYRIPVSDAESMMPLCLPGKILKTRFLVPSGKHIFEVDLFHEKNDGLIIAELELSDENESFEKPDWLGEEVTGDPRYYNSNLAK